MGLPQLDFRVPEAAWFKSAVARRIAAMPWLSSLTSRFESLPRARAHGTLAWPYKIAVVAVMMFVASGTLVTFGMAGAETPSSEGTSALPGSDEASPTVEGQALPNNGLTPGLFNPDGLLSTLNLTDYSPLDADDLIGDTDDSDDSDDEVEKALKASTSTPTANATSSPSSNSSSEPTKEPTKEPTQAPTTQAPEPVEGPKHQEWEAKKAKYDDCVSKSAPATVGLCSVLKPGSEPDFTS